MTEKGVLYIAMGERYFEEAKISAGSLKKHNPGLQTCLITDEEREADCFDQVKVREPKEGSDKVYYIGESPFDKTLYLDSDTYIGDDITEVFDILKQFDVAATETRFPREEMYEQDKIIDAVSKWYPFFQGGIILFRQSEKTREMLDKWLEDYDDLVDSSDGFPYDMPTLRKAIFESDVRFSPLPKEFNCRLFYGGMLSREVKIAHHRLIDVDEEVGLSNTLDASEVLDKINSVEGKRIYYYDRGSVNVVKRRKSLRRIFADAIREYGYKGSLKRFLNKVKTLDTETGKM